MCLPTLILAVYHCPLTTLQRCFWKGKHCLTHDVLVKVKSFWKSFARQIAGGLLVRHTEMGIKGCSRYRSLDGEMNSYECSVFLDGTLQFFSSLFSCSIILRDGHVLLEAVKFKGCMIKGF